MVMLKDMKDLRFNNQELQHLPTLKYFEPLLLSINLRDFDLAEKAQRFLKFLILENFLHWKKFGNRILVQEIVDRVVRGVTQAISLQNSDIHRHLLQLQIIITQKYITILTVQSMWT
eukprot:UN00397